MRECVARDVDLLSSQSNHGTMDTHRCYYQRLSTLVPLPLVLHHLITKRLLVRWEYNKSFKAKRPRVDINLNLIIEPKKKYSKYNQKWTVAIVAVTVTIFHEVSKKTGIESNHWKRSSLFEGLWILYYQKTSYWF